MRIKQTRDLEKVNDFLQSYVPGNEYTDDDIVAAHWWFAIEDDSASVVAFAGMTFHEQEDGTAFLLASGVVSGYRGMGLQQRLIRARLAMARKEGLRSVWTYCNVANIHSMANLVKCGFVPYTLNDSQWLEMDRKL
jgi:RimJ/RimL family protein N-acetyltransferase